MRTIGYARVSTGDQCLNLQLDALEKARCDCIFRDDGVSAQTRKRPGFQAAMDALEPGDRFVIWKMDRAFRSVLHASAKLEEFVLNDIEFVCLTEPVDLQSAHGRWIYHTRNAYAEYEREIISERTIAGLRAARKRGVRLGRPPKLSHHQKRIIRERWAAGESTSPAALASEYGVSLRTISRIVADFSQKIAPNNF